MTAGRGLVSRADDLAGEVGSANGVIDAAFGAAAGRLGDRLPCRRGCSSCCAPVFDIHPADALLLGRWLDGQSAEERQRILDRAGATIESVTAAARGLVAAGAADLADWEPADGLSALPSHSVTTLAAATTGACPLLGTEGECRAYEHRPGICRLQGLPWRDERSGSILPDFCRLVPGQERLEPVDVNLVLLDAVRAEVRDGLAGWLGARLPRGLTFVAEALVRWSGAP